MAFQKFKMKGESDWGKRRAEKRKALSRKKQRMQKERNRG